MHINQSAVSIILIALLVACSAERAPVADNPQPTAVAPVDSVATDSTPVDSRPLNSRPLNSGPAQQDVSPVPTPDAAADLPPGAAIDPYPAGAAPDGDRYLAGFDGYGQIRFGTAAADMSEAWGGELFTLGKDLSPACYFMTPTWVKTPAEFNFMIGDGKFARFETTATEFIAPGGGKVGATRSEISKLYPGRIEERSYDAADGVYLSIKDAKGGKGVLVFVIDDGKGDAAKVTRWYVGVPPQVDYVQGCT